MARVRLTVKVKVRDGVRAEVAVRTRFMVRVTILEKKQLSIFPIAIIISIFFLFTDLGVNIIR